MSQCYAYRHSATRRGGALLITLPEVGYTIFTSQQQDGDLLDAISLPIVATLGLVPRALPGAVL